MKRLAEEAGLFLVDHHSVQDRIRSFGRFISNGSYSGSLFQIPDDGEDRYFLVFDAQKLEAFALRKSDAFQAALDFFSVHSLFVDLDHKGIEKPQGHVAEEIEVFLACDPCARIIPDIVVSLEGVAFFFCDMHTILHT